MARGHLKLAHELWEKLLEPGDIAVDATCGNGHDTLILAQLGAKVTACDIQKSAIESTREQTKEHDITFILGCHSKLDINNVKLLVYNLGYLPGGDKSLTTHVETTLQSLKNLMPKVTGAISIMCYPGHPEGAREEEALIDFCSQLDWNVQHFQTDRKKAPSLLFLRR